MKKILMAVLVLAAVALGGVHWQLGRALAHVADGAAVQVGAVRITIPALQSHGRTIVPPTIALGAVDVVIDATSDSSATLHLEDARLVVDLRTLTPRITSATTAIQLAGSDDAATLRQLALDLDYHGRIIGIAAGELVLLETNGKPMVRFEKLAMEYRPGETIIPDAVGLKIGKLIVPSRREAVPGDSLAVEGVDIGIESFVERGDAMRTLKAHAAAHDMQFVWPEGEGTRTLHVKPMHGTAAAKLKNLSADEWNQLIETVHQKMPDWKRLGKQIETGDGEANINLMVTGLIDGLLRTGIVPTANEFSWDGFTLTDEKGTVLADMQASRMHGTFKEGSGGIRSTVEGSAGDLTLRLNDGATTGNVTGGAMAGDMLYPESTYADLLKNVAQGAAAPVVRQLRDQPTTAGASQVAQTLGQWAASGKARGGFDTVQFKSPTNTTSLAKTQYVLEQDGVTLKTQLSSDIVAQTLPPGLPAPQWEKGAATLALGLKTAWSGWRDLLKKLNDEKFPLDQFMTDCVRKPHEINVGVDLRGGNLGFDVALQAAAGVDGAAITTDVAGNAEAALRKLVAAAPQQVLPTLTANVTLTVNQLKALRAFIDAASPGASDQLLAQAAMFVAVDDAKDQLTSAITLKGGKWTVNGQPNPMLDLLFQEAAGH